MLTLHGLRQVHLGEAAFCMGTAPHLNQLQLELLRDSVTIGCNQLTTMADKLNLKYVCFQREVRFRQAMAAIPETKTTRFIVPESVLAQNPRWEEWPEAVKERVCPAHVRYTTPGHAEFFSFDLEHCVYAGDSIGIEIQLAVWMGCNPIYLIGVDGEYRGAQPFFDSTDMDEQTRERVNLFYMPDLCEWLAKVRTLLWARGIRLLNAAGEHSSLTVLPKTRLEAALGRPRIAVTSKTFSEDEYLVGEVKRYFSEVKVNRGKGKLEGDKLVEFLKDADGVILGTEPFTADVMGKLPCLRYVVKYGVGLDNVDFDGAKRHNIEVAYRKGVNSDSVAELVLGFALSLIRRVDVSVQAYRAGKWAKLPGRELAEMTVGIVGYGHVGKVVAAKFAALGVGRLLVHDLIDFPVAPPAEFVPLDYLLAESDIVSLHVSMEPRNYHMVNAEFLAKLGPEAWLINTSRGEVVDETALAAALRDGRLAGAALDVYEHEPVPNPELMAAPNLLTTCHIAGSSNRAIKNMGWASIEGLLKLFHIDAV